MADTQHGTLTADEVTTVTLIASTNGLEVINRDLSGAIWVRIDGEDPQIAGEDSYVVLGARQFPIKRKGTITVKLISDADRAYSVEAS
jgi:hypothetical protein